MRSLFILLCCLPTFCLGQNKGSEKTYLQTYHTSTGAKISKNDLLTIGKGSMPNGDFKFIRKNVRFASDYTGDKKFKAIPITDSSRGSSRHYLLNKDAEGLTCKVLRFELRGDKKESVYAFVYILGLKKKRFEVFIEPALKMGELKINTPSNGSRADELLKFKKLFDEGAITKDEYDQQKKKLLGE